MGFNENKKTTSCSSAMQNLISIKGEALERIINHIFFGQLMKKNSSLNSSLKICKRLVKDGMLSENEIRHSEA